MGINSNQDLPEFKKLVEQIRLPQTPQAESVMETAPESAEPQSEMPAPV